MQAYIQQQISASLAVKNRILQDADLMKQIEKAAHLVTAAYRSGKKTLLAGNGGSAADAQHIAGELVSRFYFDRPALASIALTTDTSILTAIGNDYGYERLFARQIEAHGREGDVFIAISTSGNSPNILEALRACPDRGITTIGLTGQTGGKMKDLCDLCLCVPSPETPRIQESHILIGHIICAITEKEIFDEN